MSKEKLKLLLDIYVTFFKLGSVSFGGGYAMIPLIERIVVEEKSWVDREEILDIFAVSGSLPGAIALNSSGFVGYSLAGVSGAALALLGSLTPSVIFVLTLTILLTKYRNVPEVKSAFKGIYPAIVGLIAYAGCNIGKTALKDMFSIIIMLITLLCSILLHINSILLIALGAIAGIAVSGCKLLIKSRYGCKQEAKESRQGIKAD